MSDLTGDRALWRFWHDLMSIAALRSRIGERRRRRCQRLGRWSTLMHPWNMGAHGLAACALVHGVAGCAAWMDDPDVALPKLTGIHVCQAAIVRYIDAVPDEITRFEVSADTRRCDPSLASSFIAASGGGCRPFFAATRQCGYIYQHRTVTVNPLPSRVAGVLRYRIESL